MTASQDRADDAVPADGAPGTPERRDFFRTAVAGAVGAVAGAAHGKFGLSPISPAQAQTVAAPKLGERKWWPSKWGATDEAGASNHITPAKVLETMKWVRDGRIYRIGRDYEAGMPLFGTRAFALRIPGAPTGGPFGDNRLVYNDEYLATEIGQVGTQFDGLGHIGIQVGKDGDKSEMHFYNGFTAAEINTANGLAKLGVEKLKPIVTRAHLVDILGLKGAMMDAGQEISLADVRAALTRQGMNERDIQPGDAVFFNTGWGSLWMKNNDRFNSGEPGIGLEVARWLVERDICLTGSDTWATEVVPNPDKTLAFAVHAELLTKNGILNHENLVFDSILADRKYQFVYMFAPMPLKGATGSAGSPIAMT